MQRQTLVVLSEMAKRLDPIFRYRIEKIAQRMRDVNKWVDNLDALQRADRERQRQERWDRMDLVERARHREQERQKELRTELDAIEKKYEDQYKNQEKDRIFDAFREDQRRKAPERVRGEEMSAYYTEDYKRSLRDKKEKEFRAWLDNYLSNFFRSGRYSNEDELEDHKDWLVDAAKYEEGGPLRESNDKEVQEVAEEVDDDDDLFKLDDEEFESWLNELDEEKDNG